MPEELHLSERKRLLLSAVIDAYVRTGEPVGSKLLAERLDNTVSSATIRNEMAELAAMGFLEQPHTSAGRIPTAPAFRYYIDKLMPRTPLPEQNRQDIDRMLETAANDPERLVEDAADVLAEATGCAAVSTSPSEQTVTVRRIECLQTSGRSAALVLMTSSGLIRTRLCRFDAEIPAGLLGNAAGLLSAAFENKPLSAVTLPCIQSLIPAMPEYGLACMPLLTGLLELAGESAEAEVTLSGQLNLLRHPDYAPDTVKSLLLFLSQREQLTSMLTAFPGGLRVVLGSESPRPELNGSAIILTRYENAGRMGNLGIIGPLRMDYAAAISRLEYFAKTLGRLLGEFME